MEPSADKYQLRINIILSWPLFSGSSQISGGNGLWNLLNIEYPPAKVLYGGQVER